MNITALRAYLRATNSDMEWKRGYYREPLIRTTKNQPKKEEYGLKNNVRGVE